MGNILVAFDKYNADKARSPADKFESNHFFPIVIVTEEFMLTHFSSRL